MRILANSEKYSRQQLLFVVEVILESALDRIESGMPTNGIKWEDRECLLNKIDCNPADFGPYDRGVMEAAGMALSVLFAQLTDDAMGIWDALHTADKFDEAVRNWVIETWKDKGEVVFARIKERDGRSWNIAEVYSNYPDTSHHAKVFVDTLFDEYLANNQ